MELNRKLCAFSAGSKALRAGRYNGDAKTIVLCVAYNFHERSEFTSSANASGAGGAIFTSIFTSES